MRRKSKFFKFLTDCLSFNTPKAIAFNITSILLLLLIIPTQYLSKLPSGCIFKRILQLIYQNNCPMTGIFTGCNCPGCGLTRAMSNLLHGNISKAIELNILVIPTIIVIFAVLVLNSIKIIKEK